MISRSFEKRLFPILPDIVGVFGTPFHIYDEEGIRQTGLMLKNLFSELNFQEYFAIKALPNPSILEIIKDIGFGFDCSSVPELILARNTGVHPDQIMFTSNNTSHDEFVSAVSDGGSIINFDDITLLDKIPGEFPELACFRYNPGSLRTGNSIIGNPSEAKYGVTHDQIIDAYRFAMKKGARRFGIHTMICSNELDYKYMVYTVQSLLELMQEITEALGITFEFVNMGGGIGIPYHPDETSVDMISMAREIKVLFNEFTTSSGYTPKLFLESGRYMTGPHGVLVTTVINQKHTYREYRGVDACMSSLMRPGIYGAYHHISVLDSMGIPRTQMKELVDVVGSLCENNDKFAVQRNLPRIVEGDLIVIHDTGAHGIALTSQYNGRMRPKELLLCSNGTVKLIGRAETIEDMFTRYNFVDKELSFV